MPDVVGLIGAIACVLIDSFLLSGWWLSLVFVAEDVLEFRCRCEGGVNSCFSECSLKLECDLRDVADASVGYVFIFT